MRSIDRVGMSDAATTGVVVSTRLPHPDGFAVVSPHEGREVVLATAPPRRDIQSYTGRDRTAGPAFI